MPQPESAPDGELPLLIDGQDASDFADVAREGARAAGQPAGPPVSWRARAAAVLLAPWRSGIACILGAAFCFSWAAALVKLIHIVQPDVTIFLIVVVRSVLAIAASCAAARKVPLGRLRNAHLLALRGLTGAASMTLFYAALVRIPLADAVTYMFLNPAICALLGWTLLGERFGWLTAAGCLASLAGVVCVAQPPFLFGSGGAPEEWSGVVMGLLSAFCAAASYVNTRYIGQREPAVTVAFAFHAASLLTSAVPLALGIPQPAVMPSPRTCACLLGVAACSFSAQLLLSRGFQLERAARAAAANFTQVIWGHAIGGVLFHEPSTLLGALGALLVVAGVLAVSADKQHHQAQQSTPRQGWQEQPRVKDEAAAAGAAAAAGGQRPTEPEQLGCEAEGGEGGLRQPLLGHR